MSLEILNRFAPKRLSAKAYEFIMFANSPEMKKQTANLMNPCAFILKHYPKANEIKPATARNWLDKYFVINDLFVISYNDRTNLIEALKDKNLGLLDNYILSIEEIERRREELILNSHISVFTIENVNIDPTLKREYVKVRGEIKDLSTECEA